MLKDWMSARRRMISVGVGDVSAMEQERALKQIVSSVITKNEAARHRLALRLHMRDNESPTMTDASELYEFLSKELHTMEINDATSGSTGVSTVDQGSQLFTVCAVDTQRGPPSGGKVQKPCFSWKQGHCQWGNDCRYLHTAGEKGSAKGSGNGAPSAVNKEDTSTSTTLCQWVSNGEGSFPT